MEYPDGYSTTMRCVARKVAAVEGGLVWLFCGDVISRQVDLHMIIQQEHKRDLKKIWLQYHWDDKYAIWYFHCFVCLKNGKKNNYEKCQ